MVVFDVSGSDASGGNASPIVPDVSGQFEDIPTSGETLQQEVVTYPGNTEVVTILQDCQYSNSYRCWSAGWYVVCPGISQQQKVGGRMSEYITLLTSLAVTGAALEFISMGCGYVITAVFHLLEGRTN